MEEMNEVQVLCKQAINVATHFRLGFEGEANALLVNLIDNLVLLSEKLPSLTQQKLEPLCEAIFAAQQRGDLIFIADALEHKLTKLFNE